MHALFRGAAVIIILHWVPQSWGASCPTSIFTIAASIALIESAEFASSEGSDSNSARLQIRGAERTLGVGDCLLAGEEFHLSKDENTLIKRVDVIYAGDRKTVLQGKDHGSSFRVPQGAPAYSKWAQDLIGKLFRLPSPDGLPPIAVETATRRGDSIPPDDADHQNPLRPIESLRTLPTQLLTGSTTLVVGWRYGAPPYECRQLTSEDRLMASSASASRWCAAPHDKMLPARLVIRDALEAEYGWNIEPASWDDVPRPTSLPAQWHSLPSGDRAAWGVWLWMNGGNKWRLQALSMIYAGAGDSWLAGYFLRIILDEMPLPSAAANR